MSGFKPGDKVRVTIVAEVDTVADRYMDVVYETPSKTVYEVPVILGSEGLTVVPVGEPDRYERALTRIADQVADREATAKRCDEVGRESLAVEYRTIADAVRLALVCAIEVDGVETDAARVRAHALIAEAVERRG